MLFLSLTALRETRSGGQVRAGQSNAGQVRDHVTSREVNRDRGKDPHLIDETQSHRHVLISFFCDFLFFVLSLFVCVFPSPSAVLFVI